MSEVCIVGLPHEKQEEAVECLVTAFASDPIFDYFFPGDEQQRLENMRTVFNAGCKYRFMVGEPLLAAQLSGEIVGVANVTTPDKIESTDQINQLWEETGAALYEGANERFDNYKALKDQFAPDKPHHYLVSLAVKPDRQGAGIGGKLLEAVCQLAEEHPTSEATVLDTGTAINLQFYSKHRFHSIGEEELDGVPCYWLIRNCGE